MTPREIHSLMRRLCYFGVSAVDGYRHLMRSGELDRNLVNQLIDDYITTEEVIVYASAKDCASVRRPAAFGLIQEYRLNDTCAKGQVVAADFSSRIVWNQSELGLGSTAGGNCNLKSRTDALTPRFMCVRFGSVPALRDSLRFLGYGELIR